MGIVNAIKKQTEIQVNEVKRRQAGLRERMERKNEQIMHAVKDTQIRMERLIKEVKVKIEEGENRQRELIEKLVSGQ